MAASLNQHQRNSAEATSTSITWSPGVSAGNLLVVVAGIAQGDAGDVGSLDASGYTLLASSDGSAEQVHIFAKIAGSSEPGSVKYTHGDAVSRSVHLHGMEFAGVGGQSVPASPGSTEYSHDDEGTADNSAFTLPALLGTGVMVVGYMVAGTTNADGWSISPSAWSLADDGFNGDGDASVIGWVEAADEQTPELSGGNGRSGIALLTNASAAPVVTGGIPASPFKSSVM